MSVRRLAILLLASTPIAISAQSRDAAIRPVGTAVISGVVSSPDSPPRPIPRAVVSITGTELADPRSVLTDDDGRFSFLGLPAGTFTITARKAAHLLATFGAARPNRPGSPIAVADGQRLTAHLTMFKGAVIAGTLRDPSGLPMGGVTVHAIDPRPSTRTASFLQPAVATTDDRGAYRIYGLMPGEYFITAVQTSIESGPLSLRSATDMDAILAGLSQRQRAAPTAVAPPRPARAQNAGLAPTYFPGTAYVPDAERVRLGAGEERTGVDFVLTHVPVASITGTVAGPVPDLATVEMTITQQGPRVSGVIGTMGIATTAINAAGEFVYEHVPPGRYRIVARARRGTVDPSAPPRSAGRMGGGSGGAGGATGGGPPAPYTGEQLFAVADVDVRGQDVTGLTLPLEPGGSLAGRVVFVGAAPPGPDDLEAIRIGLTQTQRSFSANTNSTASGTMLTALDAVPLGSDGTFRLTGIGPTSYSLTASMPFAMGRVWQVRSAIVEGRDLLDQTIEGPHVHLDGVTITLSAQRTDLTGRLQSASGTAAPEYFVVAFSADRAHWRDGLRRSLSTRPSTDGRFTFANLPAGEYLLAALTDLDPDAWQDAGFLAQIEPSAVRVTIREGAVTVQDLQIR